MDEKQKIDDRVDEKIDDKITTAQLPIVASLDTAENKASRTTAEEDLRTKGQREINMIWETTQRHIALFVVAVGCTVAAFVVTYAVAAGSTADPLVLAAFTLLSNICFLVAGFYFGRTNHSRIGDDLGKKRGGLDDR